VNKVLIGIAGLFVPLALIFWVLRYTPFALGNVSAIPAQSCRHMQEPADSTAAWKGDVMRVETDVYVNCAAAQTQFHVQRLGSLLLIRASTQEAPIAAGCMCARSYSLDVPGVPTAAAYTVIRYSVP
jgi:hypothetical protein